MAATTESDMFMLSTQYLMEPFGYFFQEPCSWELDELEKKLFLDVNEVDSISSMHLNSTSSPVEEEFEQKSSRNLSFSTVSEELNSLSIDQQQLQSFPSSNSPRKRAAPVMEQNLVDSKEGILASTSIDHQDYSAMGLVFSGITSSEIPSSSSRPYTNAMHRSHSLGHLQLRSSLNSSPKVQVNHHGSALDSTMQGLGSIAPSLAQLLEVDDHQHQHHHPHHHPRQLDLKSPSCSSSTSSNSSIRRVCSTGDLQRINQEAQDEGGFKIGRYSLAERKERIHRYRQKRSERNFNKKIKYACRKTLADSRPRVRGRFAKNEDVVDSPSASFMPLQQSRISSGDFDEEVDVLLEDDESLLIDRQSSGELSESWGIRYVGR